MLKNILKRTMSTFLALTLVLTTFCFFDVSVLFPTAEAAISSVSGPSGEDVYIIVPETFYMQPSPVWTDSAKASLTRVDYTAVQYYINNTFDGFDPIPDEDRAATTGKIWFDSTGTVTDLKYSIAGTNIQNVSMTAGSSYATLSGVTLTSSMTEASTRTLDWTFTCKVDGKNAEYHAYTVAYAPYYTPVGVVFDQTNTANSIQMQGLAWVSGVHSFTDTTNYSSHYPRNAYDYSATTTINGVVTPWFSPMVPLLEPVRAPIASDHNEDSMDWFTTSSSAGCLDNTFTEFEARDNGQNWGGHSIVEMCVVSQTGNLTVDISRNHNFNTIPNLTTGAIMSDIHGGPDLWYGFYMANFSGSAPGNGTTATKDNRPSPCYCYDSAWVGDVLDAGTANERFDFITGRDPASEPSGDHRANWDHRQSEKLYDGVWTCATPSDIGSTTQYIHSGFYGENSDHWIYINGYLKVDVEAVDKSVLRAVVFEKQKQANALVIDNYGEVSAGLRAAYEALGDPTVDQQTIDNAYLALDDITYSTQKKTTIVRHINARTGEYMPVDNNNHQAYELMESNIGDTVTVSPNTYTGYTLTSRLQTEAVNEFSMADWNSSMSGGTSTVSAKTYTAASDTLSLTVTSANANTSYSTSNIITSGYNAFAVDPAETYAINYEYSGTGNGKIGVLCYDISGVYLGVVWIDAGTYPGFLNATGSSDAFNSETFYFCPSMYVRPTGETSFISTQDAARTHYISLCFGGNLNDGSHGTPAASSSTPLSCVFRNVSCTQVQSLFDMNEWKNGTGGRAGSNQILDNYDATTQTLDLTVKYSDTFTPRYNSASGDIRTSGYYYFEIENPYEEFTISYEYAGTGNGNIGVLCYDEDGHYIGQAWFNRRYYTGMMNYTASNTDFVSGSFDFCPATYTRPANNSSYLTPAKGVQTKYIALSFGGNPNNGQFGPTASTSNPLTCSFRAVRVVPKVPSANLFNASAWDASSCSASGSGVSSVTYDASSDTFTVDSSADNSYTAFINTNVFNSGYNYIAVEPDTSYTLDFDYASVTRGQVGVACYDSNGDYIDTMWLYDSFTATGSTSAFRHCSEVICPQSSVDLFNSVNAACRFDIHYITLLFGNNADDGESGDVALFSNVSVTANNELFDMAQWANRTGNNYGDTNAVQLTHDDWEYDSTNKTLTITAENANVATGYPNSLLTDYVTVDGNHYPYYFTPVQPNTTYSIEGEYAGDGNGNLGILEFDANGDLLQPKVWKNPSSGSILIATGNENMFSSFQTTVTTKSDTRYVMLVFGGNGNSSASAGDPVTCVFRDVKMHNANTITVPSEDSVYTFYYRPNFFNIAFNGNGSTDGFMGTQKFIYCIPQSLNANLFSREFTVTYNANGGDMSTPTAANTTATSTFNGWATAANAPVDYLNQESVSDLTLIDGATIQLYANWTDASVTLPLATRAGYTFNGWYTAATGGTSAGMMSYTPSADIELFAQWTSNNFYITFDKNGVGPDGNMPADMTVTYDTPSDPLPAPKATTIDGWEFLGWVTTLDEGELGDDEENFELSVQNPRGGRRSTQRSVTPAPGAPTIEYYPGDVLDAATINSFYAEVGIGGHKTLYAVWQKKVSAKFVDYNGDQLRERTFDQYVFNGEESAAIAVEDFPTQGTHSGWVASGWTMTRQKGAVGSSLGNQPIVLPTDNNLFDFNDWADSNSILPNVNNGKHELNYDEDSETLVSEGSESDVVTKYYEGSDFASQSMYSVEVDPFRTYTFGVDYAGNVSGKVGMSFYDEDGVFIATAWLGEDTNNFDSSTGLTDFQHEEISFCATNFSALSSLTDAQRESIHYVAFSFGNYTDDTTISASNKSKVIYRNVTFTQDVTYYGVYTQMVYLTYDENTTETVTNMPQDPAGQNRVANSALGFGADDILNPTFALSDATPSPARDGYTYLGWNDDDDATTGMTSGNVTIDQDTTYYAIWAAHTFYIAFDENGVGQSSNMPSPITVSYDVASPALDAPTTTTVNGWVFQGWAVAGALTTVVYAAGDTIPAADIVSYYNACGGEGETYTLYAVWQKTITVTFIDYLNGVAQTRTVSKVVYNGADASVAANEIPTQNATTGWTEAGWTMLQTAGATGSAVGALTLSADRTYYGVYTKDVALSYDANAGGDTSVSGMPSTSATQTVYANSFLGLAPANTQNPTFTVDSAEPTRTGYSFLGWNESSTETTASLEGGDPITLSDNKTIYAIWEIITYNLTVNATVGGSVAGSYVGDNGATPAITVAANGTQTYQVKFNHAIISLIPTAATGYTFINWTATGITLSSTDQISQNLSFNMPDGDVTLTANFEANPYTITYNPGNGASGSTATQNCTYNQNVTFYTNGTTAGATVTAFVKTGYTFVCWNSAADGSGNDYTAGSTTTTPPNFVSARNGNYDLYAKWDDNDYNITYVLGGGALAQGVTNPSSATYDVEFYLNAPTRDGYDFAGWRVTSGVDTTTAMWGTSTAGTALSSASTVCVNGTSGNVYFKNLTPVDQATVEITAQWSPKQYTLIYSSDKGESVNDGLHYYNETITLPGSSVFTDPYAGFTFDYWIASSGGNYNAGASYTLEPASYADNTTVTMTAHWTTNEYRIVYNMNNANYSVSDLAYITGNEDVGQWNWKTAENDAYLAKGSADTVHLYGAYSDSLVGTGSCFYLNKASTDEVRFGLGWSFNAGETSTTNMIDFAHDLAITEVPDSVLLNATPVSGTPGLFDITLYMVWSANYKPLEDKVSEFQSEYMTFASGAATLRGTNYSGSSYPVYTDAPTYAMLPAIASVDAAYKWGGARAREIYPNTSDAHHGKYTWVAGGMTSAWTDLEDDDANMFVASTLSNNNANGGVNERVQAIYAQVVTDPCAQYAAGTILSQSQADEAELTLSISRLEDAMDSTEIAAGRGYILSQLLLQEVDLDKRLSDAEMAAFNTALNAEYNTSIDFGASCPTATGGGISYQMDETTAGTLHEAFDETVLDSYPPCEDVEVNGVIRHHSFNDLLQATSSVLGKANAIFALFGFDPTQARNDAADYFQSGNVDGDGYTINNNCIYTTESVYRLFDLIYGERSGSTYESATGMNASRTALYYQVMDVLGSSAQCQLKKPSQEKLDKLVTMMVYQYHSLELKDADYSEFANLFQNYFDATWGTVLFNQGLGYSSTPYLTAYQDYFTPESYNALDNWMQDYFSAPRVIWPNGDGTRDANGKRYDFPYRKIVEQNMIDGKTPTDGSVRQYINDYIDVSTVDLSNFDYADCTLCAELCDMIDQLVPVTADYTSVFRVILNNAQRIADTNTYTLNPTTYPDAASRTAFYPPISSHSDWYTLYTTDTAWEDTVEVEDPVTHETYDKPLFDTDWMYHYYSTATVNALRDYLYPYNENVTSIDWTLNKLHQNEIDTTIASNVQALFNALEPKRYEFYLYRGLSTDTGAWLHISDHEVNGSDIPYYYGTTFICNELTPNASQTSGKTFYGWYTKRDDLTHCVSDPSSIYNVYLPINSTLVDTWASAGQAEVTEVSGTNGVVYRVNLYGGYVDNVALHIDMRGGTARYEAKDENGVTQETNVLVSGDEMRPSKNYNWTLTFSQMAKTGYTFDSWLFTAGANNVGSDMTGNVYTYGYYTAAQPTEDTLVAQWTANTYTVTFYKNHTDATGNMGQQTLTYDEQDTLDPNTFERTGYSFDFWSTNSDGTGTTYTDEATVLNLCTGETGNTNIDLYANWRLADFTLTFDVADGTWQGWNAGVTGNSDTLTKTIRYNRNYGDAIVDGKTWPVNPIKAVTVVDGMTIYAHFEGWYLADSNGDPTSTLITSSTPVNDEGDRTVVAVFENTNVQDAKTQIQAVLGEMNANYYTLDSMQDVDDAIDAILTDANATDGITAADVAALNAAVAALEPANLEADGDVSAPIMKVYENKHTLRDAVDNDEFTGDTSYILGDDSDSGEISFVFPGKAYYTYYCYTNSTNPAIMVDAHDVAGTSNRVSYPTQFAMDTTGTNSSGQPRTRSGLVYSGWMNYSTDPAGDANTTGRTADYEIMNRKRTTSPYENQLQYFGRDYSKGIYATEDDDSYEYYTHEQYLLLKPTFVNDGTKQYALYTFEVKDDSYNNLTEVSGNDVPTGLAADRALLAGATNYQNYATDGADLTSPANTNITQTNTITIFVEYYNTMKGYNGNAGGQYAPEGVGTFTNSGALEVYNNFHEDGNTWVKVDYLYRNAAGIANTDFVAPQTLNESGSYPYYDATDPVFGEQTNAGSFYYLMKPSDPATSAYWDAYQRYIDEENPSDLREARVAAASAAIDLINAQVKEEIKDEDTREKMAGTWAQATNVTNGTYIYWPHGDANTQWSSQFYAGATEDAERLVYVHIFDRYGNHYTNILIRDLQDATPSRALTSTRGKVTVNEMGGSSIRNISITALNSDTPVPVSGMTDNGAWNVTNNQFMITGLPQGDDNFNYTMTVTDVAGNTQSSDFQAASDGSVVLTINDETMGGSYAAAAAAPDASAQNGDPENGIIAPEIVDEAPLTTLSVEEVQPDEITPNTIEEATEAQASPEEEYRPDLYTFTLNEVYTVNLFAASTRDYAVTLKSTIGGIVKTYVNGEFAPVKSGKVIIPSGSQVQVRVSMKAGYELESLTMIYPDGTTVDLVGSYNAEINDDVTIKAVFVKTDALVTIHVENGAISAKQTIKVSPYSLCTAVAAAAPEGKVFAYWSQDGEDEVPVSYDEIYTFIATSDVNLKAIYADETVEETANIAMDAASASQINVVNGMYTLSYSGKITLPEGAQIEDFGLLLTNQSADDCSDENFRVGGKINGVNVAKLSGQTLTKEGQCKINVNNVKPGQTRTGRLYLIVKLADGSTQTIYSNTWSELTTPAA